MVKHRNTWCWGHSTIIAIKNGKGIVTVSFEDEIPDEATITGLSVHESIRNKGFGNKLLIEAEKEAKFYGVHKLNIYADDETFAYEWYQRHGYSRDYGSLYLEYPNIKHLSKKI